MVANATERIVERDDATRTYVYEYLTGPLPLQSYRSRFTVQEHPEGSEIVWTADFTTGDVDADPGLADAIGGIYGAGLKQLRTRLESTD